MSRCLCCGIEIKTPSESELKTGWHDKCVKRFFGTTLFPEIDCSEKELERLANLTVNKGLTVPGVQKKLSLHLEKKDRGAKLTIVDYPTGYILKPQSAEYTALPQAEHLAMSLADITGIKTVPYALIRMNGIYSYVTKRVDRTGGKMLAMEDFCQLSGRAASDKYKSSYENCSKVIREYSKNPGIDLAELFHRLLFCFITGNSDMHLKNFSLIEDAPGSRIFGLSPAYDMLPVNIIMPADTEETALSLNGKKRNIRRKDFLKLADNFGIPENAAERMIARIARYKEEFIREVNDSYIPDEMKKSFTELIGERICTINV